MGLDEALVFVAPNRIPECSARYDQKVVGFHLQLTMGPLELSYDDRRHVLGGGEWIWATRPGPRIRFQPIGDSTWFHRHVGFMGSKVNEWRQLGIWPDVPLPAPPGRNWAQTFDELIELSKGTDPWERRRATNLIEGVLMECAQASRVTPPPGTWLQQVVLQLHQQEFSPDYRQIADRMSMSESALRRRFKKESGDLAIHEYVVLSRLGRAKVLLESTELTLSEIAEQCGYTSEPFFARQFRAHALMTPGQYRNLTHRNGR